MCRRGSRSFDAARPTPRWKQSPQLKGSGLKGCFRARGSVRIMEKGVASKMSMVSTKRASFYFGDLVTPCSRLSARMIAECVRAVLAVVISGFCTLGQTMSRGRVHMRTAQDHDTCGISHQWRRHAPQRPAASCCLLWAGAGRLLPPVVSCQAGAGVGACPGRTQV